MMGGETARVICNRGGGADGDPPLKSCSCVCYAELVFSCIDGSGNWFRERLGG